MRELQTYYKGLMLLVHAQPQDGKPAEWDAELAEMHSIPGCGPSTRTEWAQMHVQLPRNGEGADREREDL